MKSYSYNSLIYNLLNSLPKGRTELSGHQNFILMQELLARLGNPHFKLDNVIHIAGTNGKGSTTAFLTYLLESQGYTVNTYTSPHLMDITERIRINGNNITEESLYSHLSYIMHYHDQIPFNYFQALTAIAFMAYNESPSDFTILETGMGGRYDATNVISAPLATVFTPIAMDHQAYLGETIGLIAGEKAAITKPGSPMFSANQEPEVTSILLDQAIKMKNSILIQGNQWNYELESDKFYINSINDFYGPYPLPGLPGIHQIQNASLALVTLNHFKLIQNISSAGQALRNVFWPGRLMESRYNGVDVLLDGAHNISAAKVLVEYLKDRYVGRKLNLIFSMTKSENTFEFLAMLKPWLACVFTPYLDQPFIDRSIIQKICSILKVPYQEWDTLELCLEKTTYSSELDILITGSLYLVGESMILLSEKEN